MNSCNKLTSSYQNYSKATSQNGKPNNWGNGWRTRELDIPSSLSLGTPCGSLFSALLLSLSLGQRFLPKISFLILHDMFFFFCICELGLCKMGKTTQTGRCGAGRILLAAGAMPRGVSRQSSQHHWQIQRSPPRCFWDLEGEDIILMMLLSSAWLGVEWLVENFWKSKVFLFIQDGPGAFWSTRST